MLLILPLGGIITRRNTPNPSLPKGGFGGIIFFLNYKISVIDWHWISRRVSRAFCDFEPTTPTRYEDALRPDDARSAEWRTE
jgi:hypothetical protein